MQFRLAATLDKLMPVLNRHSLLLVVAMTGGSSALHASPAKAPGLQLRQGAPQQTPPVADGRLRGGGGRGGDGEVVEYRGTASHILDVWSFLQHLWFGKSMWMSLNVAPVVRCLRIFARPGQPESGLPSARPGARARRPSVPPT